jgi:serine/threonine protein kinase
LKLADFGLARVFHDGVDHTNMAITEYVTTRWYRAPEILAGWTHYGSAIDMWAVGCILGELFKRSPLFPGSDSVKQLEMLLTYLGKPEEYFIIKCKKSSKR